MKHQYLLELGGENTELGKIEALELLLTEHYRPKLILDEKSIITISVSEEIKSKVIRRLGMTKRVSKIVYVDKETNLENVVKKMPFLDIGQKSFAIRQISNRVISEKKIASVLGEKIPKHNKTNLNNPDIKILYYTGAETIISIWDQRSETYYKRCLKHHIKNRPFFSPISIHPRIARSMINLANCSENETIIDPFCGTGGMLIEASDMQINAIGIDIMKKMVDYSNGNLEHFGLKGKVIEGDIKDITNYQFKAIVTDPPYGLSTTTKGEGVDELMRRSMDIFNKTMNKGERVVLALSKPELIENPNYNEIYRFKWYIHKSLTRNIIVLEKN
jgi:tRNA (guanine10-N2)-dimethyltransferase|tara:strand:+ start:9108 stop:10103 length:996 start_codon:yes stop_codon:yes gene_type:complete